MPNVYLSIGSNIDRESNVRSAMRTLRRYWPRIIFSPVYESTAVGFAGEDFFNLAAAFSTEQELGEVLAILRRIEEERGRTRGGPKFSARSLDLDLLCWGEAVIEDGTLALPREELLLHDFVLLPLVDIAPEAVHPVSGLTYRRLWQQFNGVYSIRRVVSLD